MNRRIIMKKTRRNKNIEFYFGIIIIVAIVLFSFLGPVFYRVDPDLVDLFNISSRPMKGHILGTDEIGRDILARLMYGGRVSILVGIVATGLKIVISVVLGTISGYFRGPIDSIIMRLADIIMCFPFYILAISLAAIVGPSAKNLVLIIALFNWPQTSRVIRGEVLRLNNENYILAAKINGFSSFYIISNHIIPNILPTIFLTSTLSIAQSILIESSLSFLGMGVRPPMASWGNMLSSAQNMMTLQREWWIWLPAGIFVIMTVLSINFIGDGLERRLTE